MYSASYQFSHDIDWFFLFNGIPVHVSSNGGLLPRNLYTAHQLRMLQNEVSLLEKVTEVELNKPMLDKYILPTYSTFNNLTEEEQEDYMPDNYQNDIKNEPAWVRAYSWRYKEMASRGFFCFDRLMTNEYPAQYILVASPHRLIELPPSFTEKSFKVDTEKNNIDEHDFDIIDATRPIALVKYINEYISKTNSHYNIQRLKTHGLW